MKECVHASQKVLHDAPQVETMLGMISTKSDNFFLRFSDTYGRTDGRTDGSHFGFLVSTEVEN